MLNSVLYYPQIRVPETTWLTRLLLYWDSVGIIVPHEYLEDPERLGEHTRSLVQHELVRQVVPVAHLWQVNEFESSFMTYLRGLGLELAGRRQQFRAGSTHRIHVEKLEHLCEELRELEVASEVEGYSWCRVEKATADDFMCYLAGILGRLEDVNAMPVTDDPSYLNNFFSGQAVSHAELNGQLTQVRMEILNDVFPAPRRPLTAEEIANFKSSHGRLLSRLRRTIEREVIAVVDVREEGLKQRRLELFREELHEDITELQARFRQSGFGDLVFGRFFSVIGNVPGVPSGFGLVSAIYNALRGVRSGTADPTLAYAAHYREQLAA
jgi:hypothetical protein